jgi:excisionase family DNA binding protein
MSEADERRAYMRTNEAARAVGVSRQTLLRWLQEGKVRDVKRDRNGWRVFSQEDVARLRRWARSGTEGEGRTP